MGDETWVYGYDVKTKLSLHNGYEKRHPDPKKHGKFGPM
jgi:hypothetical protein